MRYSTIFFVVLLHIVLGCSSSTSGHEHPGVDTGNSSDAGTQPLKNKKQPSEPQDDENVESDESPATVSSPEEKGPHAVKSYSESLSDSAFASAVVYYPSDVKDRKLAATTLSGGYTNTKEQMTWLAEHLASHGIIVIIFTPTNAFTTDAEVWKTGHIGSVRKLKSETIRQSSPIFGIVDTDRVGISGFSMGGAGTILAVNSEEENIKAAIPLCPYRPLAITADVPTLFVTGTNDTTAVPANVESAFNSTNTGASNAFLSLEGMTHRNIITPDKFKRQLTRYLTAWYKVFLAGEKGYTTFIDGAEQSADQASGGISKYEYSSN